MSYVNDKFKDTSIRNHFYLNWPFIQCKYLRQSNLRFPTQCFFKMSYSNDFKLMILQLNLFTSI